MMPHPIATPLEADALRRLAEAMNRVHLPATLLQFLLVLLAFLTGTKSIPAPMSGRTWRTPLRDWQFSPTGETIDDLAPVLHPRALRRLHRQRAWIGWILRGLPGLGLRLSGKRAPKSCSPPIARAPPSAGARAISS